MNKLETKIPPIFLAAFGALLIFLLSLIDPFLFDSTTQRAVALIPIIIGVSLAFSGIYSFRKAKTTVNPHLIERTTSFVASGPYIYTRNPMYLGMILTLCGFAIWEGTILGLFLGVTVTFSLLTSLQIKPEERFLRKKFGQQYVIYCTNVRRWL